MPHQLGVPAGFCSHGSFKAELAGQITVPHPSQHSTTFSGMVSEDKRRGSVRHESGDTRCALVPSMATSPDGRTRLCMLHTTHLWCSRPVGTRWGLVDL